MEKGGINIQTKEERLLNTISEMFYAAPALLHPLVRKCHDENFEIPADIKNILEKKGFIIDGTVPENIKQFIVKNIKITGKNRISMTM
ncbi:MAG: hypothetical protein WC788_01145 [Candidatus Paceibacterota bacterium]